MKHRQCSVCGIIEGGDLCAEVLTEYRGIIACSFCIRGWQAMEKETGGEVEFMDFKYRGRKIPVTEKGVRTVRNRS